MKQSIHVSTEITRYDDIEELENIDHIRLCKEAIRSTKHAYAPYSNYQVGAGVLLEDGSIVIGNNQENAVYPLGLCAERVAIFSATSRFPAQRIAALAVYTLKTLAKKDLPPFPCGSCRQVILEMEDRYQTDILVYVVGSDQSVCQIASAKDLLPLAFNQLSL